jgi:hypothetical protein
VTSPVPIWRDRRAVRWLWIATRLALIAGLAAYVGTDRIMGYTRDWADALRAGRSPYEGDPAGYPPLAMLSFLIPGVVGTSVTAFRLAFPLLVLAVDAVGLRFAKTAERAGRDAAAFAYTVGVPLAGPGLLLWRYDLLPAVAHLAALVFALRGRRTASWLALGVGIALKPYLLVALPVWLLWEWQATSTVPRHERIGRGLLAAAAPTVVAAALLLPAAGASFTEAYTFQAGRGLAVDSTGGIVAAEAGSVTGRPIAVVDDRCVCVELAGRGPDAIRHLSIAALAAALGAIYLAGARARPGVETLAIASTAAVAVQILLAPVFSPQYVVWLLAPLAVLAGTRHGRTALVAAGAAAVLVAVEYPWLRVAAAEHHGWARLVLIARTAALAVAAAALLRALVAQRRSTPSSSASAVAASQSAAGDGPRGASAATA